MRCTGTRRSRSQGFTLIELMVGLALGLLTILIITQVLAVSQGKTRTIGAGNEAQVNGSLAIFTLTRDIQQAGYGLAVTQDAIGCPVKGQLGSASEFNFRLSPIVITSGLSASAPDSITILRSNTADSALPMPLTTNHVPTDNKFIVASALGTHSGDMVVAVPDSLVWETDATNWWCSMLNVKASTTNPITPTSIPHESGGWNQASIMPAGTLRGSALATQPRSYLLDLGSLVLHTYSVSDGGNLQIADFSASSGAMEDPTDIYSQVVNLKALYGKDTDGDGVVDTYDNVTPTTNAGWLQVRAVRLAVVTRSTNFEKEEVTKSAPLWDVGASVTISGLDTEDCNGESKCVAVPVDHLDSWGHYRYKIYDTTVPLRNVLWNS